MYKEETETAKRVIWRSEMHYADADILLHRCGVREAGRTEPASGHQRQFHRGSGL